MLATARGLMTNPDLLLMDEPSEGLAPLVVEELAGAMRRLAAADGLTLVVVEQNLRLAFDIAPRVVVMDRGRIVYDGASATLAGDAARLDRLLGVADR